MTMRSKRLPSADPVYTVQGTASDVLLTQLNPLFRVGSKRALAVEDFGTLPPAMATKTMQDKFGVEWSKELKLPAEQRSLWRALFRSVGWLKPTIAAVLSLICANSAFAIPLLQKAISQHLAGIQVLSTVELWVLVSLSLVIPVLGQLLQVQQNAMFATIAVQVRNALVSTIYSKCLTMGPAAKKNFTTGEVTTMFAQDTSQIENMFEGIAVLISSPVMVVVSLALIFQEVDVAMFVGFGVIVGLMPVLGVGFYFISKHFGNKFICTDQRVRLTSEILNGIRIVKFYGWQDAFAKSVETIRIVELGHMLMGGLWWAAMGAVIAGIPAVLPVVVFYCYVGLGHQLDYIKAFTTLLLFGQLQGPIISIPGSLNQLVYANTSAGRILKFLNCESPDAYVTSEDNDGQFIRNDVVIAFSNANLGWSRGTEESTGTASAVVGTENGYQQAESSEQDVSISDNSKKVDIDNEIAVAKESSALLASPPADNSEPKEQTVDRSVYTLTDINLCVKRGNLVSLVGAVGSGKTSVLSALLGDMVLRSGTVYLRGSIAYHQQQPWVLNDTIEENIVFGSPYDAHRLQEVIEVSALEQDIASQPLGIQTEIGERGITLSGGQKARISFARALYREADVYLFDDPLSAVDAMVGETLFTKGISDYLIQKRGKTVILVTHQIHFLKASNDIVVLSEGKITGRGDYESLERAGMNLNFTEAEVSTERVEVEEVGAANDENREAATADERERKHSLRKSPDGEDEEIIETRERHSSIRSNRPSSISRNSDVQHGKDAKNGDAKSPVEGDDQELMAAEDRKVGRISLTTYQWYCQAGGTILIVGLFVFTAAGRTSNILGSFWLKDWGQVALKAVTTTGVPLSTEENLSYLGKYAWLSLLLVAGDMLATTCVVNHAMRAGRWFHQKLLHSILSAPIAFFDTTPIGRIINRFSGDVSKADTSVAGALRYAFDVLCSLLGNLAAIAASTNGTFLALLAPLSLLYGGIWKYYVSTNTELLRLSAISMSPITVQFAQTMAGVTSIRAYGEQAKFYDSLAMFVDAKSNIDITSRYCNTWLNIRLGILGSLVSFFIFVLAVATAGMNIIPPDDLSLALLYSTTLPGLCSQVVVVSAVVEGEIVAIERIKHYATQLPPEETAEQQQQYEENPVAESWPESGAIEIQDAVMGYRTGPDILKGLSFEVHSKEKVGIAGRTGSGKSSLMIALFRIENLRSGSIKIDNRDIATVSLKTLRSRLGIIPQDPIMFSASLKFNLDPFNEHSDERLWDVLERTNMKEAVSNLPGKLSEMVAEGGDNFSVGQRQLICFARALLRNPKVLVLDEATANVDNATDGFIQQMIRESFKDCTVLTIAHRLHTIIDSDRIITMDAGRVAEIDKPHELIKKEDGIFAALWKQHETNH